MLCNETRFGQKYGCRTLNKYDFSSISHYPNIIGENNPRIIIVNKTNCGTKGCNFGQRNVLSPLDVADIEKLYQCGKLDFSPNLLISPYIYIELSTYTKISH